MDPLNSSIRDFIQTTLKTFPWAYDNQGEVIGAYADYILGGRDSSWKSYERVGIEDFTAKQFQYSLLYGEFHLQRLKQYCVERLSKLDRRERIIIAVDDTDTARYGSKVFGAARQYNHSSSAVQNVNVLVNCWISSNSYQDYEYQVYLPRAFLERDVGHTNDLNTKIEQAYNLFNAKISTLLIQGCRPERIYCTCDSWFACERLMNLFRETGVKTMMNVKKNLQCNLFGMTHRLDETFAASSRWRRRINPRTGKDVFFMEKKLNVSTLGKCKVFAIRRGNEREIRYYATNHTKMTIETFLQLWEGHWSVETLHKMLKEYFRFDGCYSGREIINLSYWSLVYLLHYLFSRYRFASQQRGKKITFKQMYENYCFDYDVKRAKRHFRTGKQAFGARRRMEAGWC